MKDKFIYAKKAAPDVRARVGRRVVVHVKQPVILVLVVVTTDVQTRVRSVEVPVIARIKRKPHRTCTDNPYILRNFIQMRI